MTKDTNKEGKMTSDAQMYIYATEMVAHYYKPFKLEDKRVLTIIGSGDQVLNAMFYGAKEVIGFDINRNSLFLTELKISAILVLSYKEFLEFFSHTKEGFSHILYLKMKDFLSKEAEEYFGSLYENVEGGELGASEYFRDRSKFIKNKEREINAYLEDNTAYEKMREILEHARPVLYVENILTLNENKKISDKKFDIINLSNVPNYLTGKSFGLSEDNVLSYFHKLKKLIATNGIIFFYSYSNSNYPNSIAPSTPPISRDSFLEKIKQTQEFKVSVESFPGITIDYDRITLLGC